MRINTSTALSAFLAGCVLLGLAGSYPVYSSAGTSDDAMRERGKQIFSNKCAQCHDADAAKKLPDGTTLLARLAASSDPRARLATRLNKMSNEDHQAVVFYVEELIARYRSDKKTAAPPPN